MKFIVTCQDCGSQFEIESIQDGVYIECSNCRRILNVPVAKPLPFEEQQEFHEKTYSNGSHIHYKSRIRRVKKRSSSVFGKFLILLIFVAVFIALFMLISKSDLLNNKVIDSRFVGTWVDNDNVSPWVNYKLKLKQNGKCSGYLGKGIFVPFYVGNWYVRGDYIYQEVILDGENETLKFEIIKFNESFFEYKTDSDTHVKMIRIE